MQLSGMTVCQMILINRMTVSFVSCYAREMSAPVRREVPVPPCMPAPMFVPPGRRDLSCGPAYALLCSAWTALMRIAATATSAAAPLRPPQMNSLSRAGGVCGDNGVAFAGGSYGTSPSFT